MRNSNILKWGQNHKQDKAGNRNWIHPPDALQKGHIAYLVKFLGNTEVDQPKGIEVVKEGIRKLKFNHQLRKSEGSKTPKVELTISVDGVAIQEPKTKRIMHQYPLHRISYCADDKGEKKFFSFIAKESADNEQHSCFVFVSDKLAEEITLTIGQAFDLAYKRFLETSGRDLEVQRRLMVLQQGFNRLEHENLVLRQRLSGVISGQIQNIDEYIKKNKISDMLEVRHPSDQSSATNSSDPTYVQASNGTQGPMLLLNLSSNSLDNTNSSNSAPPPVPPRAFENNTFRENDFMSTPTPSVGTKLEGLLMDELEDDFNPRASENANNMAGKVFNNGNTTAASSPPPLLAPPPKPIARRTGPAKQGGQNQDMFGASPFAPSPLPRITDISESTHVKVTGTSLDPFGMADFCASSAEPSEADLEKAIGLFDKKILEMKDGFSRGLTFGNEDFSLESLDPLRK